MRSDPWTDRVSSAAGAASGNRSSNAIFQEQAAAADNKVIKAGSQGPGKTFFKRDDRDDPE